MEILSDPRVIAAMVSAVVAGVFGYFNILRIRKEMKHADFKFDEEIATRHLNLRVEPYEELMKKMRLISSYELRDMEIEEVRAQVEKLVTELQSVIFGLVGILASHETRETIIRFRAYCINYLDGKDEFKKVNKAAWEVHQMLRYDLGLSQPGLHSSIVRIRRQEIPEDMEEIERLLTLIEHNEWEYRGHGQVSSTA